MDRTIKRGSKHINMSFIFECDVCGHIWERNACSCKIEGIANANDASYNKYRVSSQCTCCCLPATREVEKDVICKMVSDNVYPIIINL